MTERKTIKAPSKVEWTLRFQNRCLMCGKAIPMNKSICDDCRRKRGGF